MAERPKADDLQERVLQICREQIISGLSRICDRLTQNGEHLILTKMEIDIGAIAEDRLEEQLPDLLQQQFEEQIRRHIFSSAVNSDTSRVLSEGNAGQEKAGRTPTEVLVYYFRYGLLPWWNPYQKTNIDSWINQQIENQTDAFWKVVEQHLYKSAVRKRMIRHLNNDQLKVRLAKKSRTDVWPLYEVLQKWIVADQRISISQRNLRQLFFDVLLRPLETGDASGIDRAKPTKEQKKSAIIYTLRRLNNTHNVPEDSFPELREKLTAAMSLFTTREWKQIFKKDDEHPELEKEYAASDQTESIPDRRDPFKKEEQFISIQNAGLVLLWPYLEKLFTHLAFVENGQFSGQGAICKAVHLLHFIGTGTEEGREHQWPLNKLLCGLSPDAFISEEIELTPSEKQEARAMVKAAIGHWEALKSTSVSGFRETFLQREGIITSDPNGWKVQIDRVAYDILLDRLPWPISIINLPWNDHITYVQW